MAFALPILSASAVIPDTCAAVHLVRVGYDAEGVDGFCRGEGSVTRPAQTPTVMPGLDPGIHLESDRSGKSSAFFISRI
jgi:hypothetical protein